MLKQIVGRKPESEEEEDDISIKPFIIRILPYRNNNISPHNVDDWHTSNGSQVHITTMTDLSNLHFFTSSEQIGHSPILWLPLWYFPASFVFSIISHLIFNVKTFWSTNPQGVNCVWLSGIDYGYGSADWRTACYCHLAWNQIWADDYDLMSLLRIIAFGLLMSLLQNIKIFGLDMILRIFKAQPLHNFSSVVYHNLIIVTETRQHSNSYCGISSFKFQLQLILLLYSAQKTLGIIWSYPIGLIGLAEPI